MTDDIIEQTLKDIEGRCYNDHKSFQRCKKECPDHIRISSDVSEVGRWLCNLPKGHPGPHHAHAMNRPEIEHCMFIWEDEYL